MPRRMNATVEITVDVAAIIKWLVILAIALVA
jgi:hypothetical protein